MMFMPFDSILVTVGPAMAIPFTIGLSSVMLMPGETAW